MLRSYKNLTAQEQCYFDGVVHAMSRRNTLENEWTKEYAEDLLLEADAAGRRWATSPDVRAIFTCIDLGLSPRQCVKFLTGEISQSGMLDMSTGQWSPLFN